MTIRTIQSGADRAREPPRMAVNKLPFIFLLGIWGGLFFPAEVQAQIITTVAGGGPISFLGEGGPATLATLGGPDAIALDSSGNLYIADPGYLIVRKVNAATGLITTVAGSVTQGFSGDGGPATLATMYFPSGVALDRQNNIYISDYYNEVVRKVTASTGIITTFAGTGLSGGYSGDGGPAASARLSNPVGLVFDALGNLYIADSQNGVVRKVDPGTGLITTFAGTGVIGYSGDGGPATLARLNNPEGLVFDSLGNLYIADNGDFVVRKVSAGTGIINTVAGSGVTGFAGDGGPATLARFSEEIDGLAVGCGGVLYLTDDFNSRIRTVSPAGIVNTVFGTGVPGNSGDGGSPVTAQFSHPEALVFNGLGDLYIADYDFGVIRKISPLCPPTPTPAATGTPEPCGMPIETFFYPNPASGSNGTILFNLCEAGSGTIRIYNAAAEGIGSYSFTGNLGVNRRSVDIGGLAHGIYYYVVQVEGAAGTQKSKTSKFAVTR